MKDYLTFGAHLNKQNNMQNHLPIKTSVPPQKDSEPFFSHEYTSSCPFSSLADIKGMNILIMGLGLHGGGESSVRFFLKYGANITITDLKDKTALAPSLDALKNDPSIDFNALKFVLGRHDINDFEIADLVIKNPGVKYTGNPYLARAKYIETDISIFLRFTNAPIIAITGSKGKSSTASALHFGLQNAGFHSFLGGNITNSPLNFLEQTNSQTPVVLELSSWQLSDLRGRNVLKPKVAIITKIVPDHLNWYGTMENYIEDKKLIYKNQDNSDYTICSSDIWGDLFASETKARVLRYNNEPFQDLTICGGWISENKKAYVTENIAPMLHPSTLLGTEDLKNSHNAQNSITNSNNTNARSLILDDLLVPGNHIRENLLIASLAMAIFGVSPSKTAKIMARFPGVPHRLEFFHSISSEILIKMSQGTEDLQKNISLNKINYLFYNDSAATVPEAVIAALHSFSSPIHLICGGTDKNLNFTNLAKSISKVESIYLLEGTGTELLIQELKSFEKSSVPYHGPFSSLQTLLSTLKLDLIKKTLTTPKKTDEIILFSPGATSFNMFSNEFDRGNTFKELVLDIF